MEKLKKDVLTAFAIGSSHVSACIAMLDKDRGASIIGLGKSEGKLIGKKGVLEIDALTRAMRDSLKTAQEEADISCPKALVSISGGSINIKKSTGMIKIGQKGGEISDKNVRDAIRVAEAIPIAIEREIIHSIPQDFIIDDQEGVKNPVGLYGVKLEVKSLLIAAHFPFLQNITKCLNLAGVELDDIVFSGIASSKSLLSEETEGKGVILIEIDNNFTTLSVFFDNVLRGVDIHQKSVIANGVLEVLKKKVDEIRSNKPISKIILAGGAYVHEDFIEKVDSIFGIPSQMGYLQDIRGSARDIYNPAHLSSVGLALYGLERRANMGSKRQSFGLLHKARRRVSDFLEEYF